MPAMHPLVAPFELVKSKVVVVVVVDDEHEEKEEKGEDSEEDSNFMSKVNR